MLLNIFANILELPIDLALNEAIKKLQGTYMVLNGTLVYIRTIEDVDLMYVSNKQGNILSITGEDVESLEVWLPETGISIFSPTNRALVYKYPEKQWHKSFNYNFYSTSLLDVLVDQDNIPFLVHEKGIIKTNKPYLFKESVWYLDKCIGDVSEGYKEIYVVDKRFFQECYEEFSKEYKVCQTN